MEEIKNDDQPATKEELSNIYQQIKESYMHDCDRTEYMKDLIKIIEDILNKDKIEDYFKENKDAFSYFIDSFFKEVIQRRK